MTNSTAAACGNSDEFEMMSHDENKENDNPHENHAKHRSSHAPH